MPARWKIIASFSCDTFSPTFLFQPLLFPCQHNVCRQCFGNIPRNAVSKTFHLHFQFFHYVFLTKAFGDGKQNRIIILPFLGLDNCPTNVGLESKLCSNSMSSLLARWQICAAFSWASFYSSLSITALAPITSASYRFKGNSLPGTRLLQTKQLKLLLMGCWLISIKEGLRTLC